MSFEQVDLALPQTSNLVTSTAYYKYTQNVTGLDAKGEPMAPGQ